MNKHNRWSSAEAEETILRYSDTEVVKENILGTPIERTRWLKNRIYGKLPLFCRSLLYFVYRYFCRFGFLDGIEGLIYHFLQGLWFRFLVDAKIYERKLKRK